MDSAPPPASRGASSRRAAIASLGFRRYARVWVRLELQDWRQAEGVRAAWQLRRSLWSGENFQQRLLHKRDEVPIRFDEERHDCQKRQRHSVAGRIRQPGGRLVRPLSFQHEADDANIRGGRLLQELYHGQPPVPCRLASPRLESRPFQRPRRRMQQRDIEPTGGPRVHHEQGGRRGSCPSVRAWGQPSNPGVTSPEGAAPAIMSSWRTLRCSVVFVPSMTWTSLQPSASARRRCKACQAGCAACLG